MAKKVYIGVGHGGSDPGAAANGFKESNLNLDIAKACRDELVRHGLEVKISRESDVNKDLSARIKECNAYKPDFAIDIHNNAGGGDGAEVFHSKSDVRDDEFAKNILTEIYAIGQNMHSTKPTVIESGMKTKLNQYGTDYFGFVRQITICPSVLVECAFVDNKKDLEIIDTLAERKTMGIAIAKGILKTFGITYKKETVTTPPTNTATSSAIKKGDLVSIKAGAKYYNGVTVPSWVQKQKWYVSSVSGNRAVIDKNESGTNAICSPINVMYLTLAKKTVEPTIKVGSTVKVKQGAKTYTGGKLANFVYGRKHKVKELKGDRAVITYLGITVAAVNIKDLTLV